MVKKGSKNGLCGRRSIILPARCQRSKACHRRMTSSDFASSLTNRATQAELDPNAKASHRAALIDRLARLPSVHHSSRIRTTRLHLPLWPRCPVYLAQSCPDWRLIVVFSTCSTARVAELPRLAVQPRSCAHVIPSALQNFGYRNRHLTKSPYRPKCHRHCRLFGLPVLEVAISCGQSFKRVAPRFRSAAIPGLSLACRPAGFV
ncbi:hypothetical protein BCR44DRAFT_276719 [Catenaria anguillulae PL171]|uniref:Uncharacterized protein n=1 Tax=Catenaria anguillulae PL171 TaxID=765915 RepID=A0A1Y2H523_9FUNG|nr:hypothetical protein BCR44DRAFT_276719 [Catenaria anguillulae PL171]